MILIFVRAPKANMLDFMLNMNNIEKSISNSMVSKICGEDVNIHILDTAGRITEL